MKYQINEKNTVLLVISKYITLISNFQIYVLNLCNFN